MHELKWYLPFVLGVTIAGGCASGRSFWNNDGDNLSNSKDACPDEPEDYDDFEDEDGCPELDNDQDGILDHDDQCPNEPEDKDGYEDEDGCPEWNEFDRDGDGIVDKDDRCPDDPADVSGDGDGCPGTMQPGSSPSTAGSSGPKPQRGPLRLEVEASMLVLELKVLGNAPAHLGAAIGSLLLSELDNVANLRSLGTEDIAAMLDVERRQDLLACQATSCYAEIGGALGTDMVLYGAISRLGSKYNIAITTVETSSTSVSARISRAVDADVDRVAAAIPSVVRELVDEINARRTRKPQDQR